VIDWIGAMLVAEARRTAGDPGVVLARRLSNAEYNYTIRDLTGVDLKPTREFPVDPANQFGFDNTGESLTMSPALFNKYLLAAREVADHMALTPGGLLALPTNIGSRSQSGFGVLPELGVNTRTAIWNRTSLIFGYNLIVLNDVLPPGCEDPAVVSNRMELELRCVPPVVAQLGHHASDFDSPVNWLELARMSAIAE
jgi:hypothetical protein